MDSSDSDITDAERGEVTTTNVLLGFASEEETSDTISQLGGYPVSPTNLVLYRTDLTSHGLVNLLPRSNMLVARSARRLWQCSYSYMQIFRISSGTTKGGFTFSFAETKPADGKREP